MKNVSVSTKVYWLLVVVLAISNAIYIYLPFPGIVPSQNLPIPKPVLAFANFLVAIILYGGLGAMGLKLSQKLGFADLWDRKVTNKQRFLIPGLVGLASGIFLIVIDSMIGNLQSLGHIPHPPFPTSIVASISAGIGEEIMFRLFFISFWTWIISNIILKKRFLNQVFWIITGISAIVFAVGHFPTILILYNVQSIIDIPLLFILEILLLNGTVSILAAYYFRKFGFLAAVGIHFWTDIVWHVIYGSFV